MVCVKYVYCAQSDFSSIYKYDQAHPSDKPKNVAQHIRKEFEEKRNIKKNGFLVTKRSSKKREFVYILKRTKTVSTYL